MITPARQRILKLLLREPRTWWPLVRIAKGVGFAHPTVLEHLGKLQEAELVETRHEGEWGRGSRYRISAASSHFWCDPERRILVEWRARGAIDWRFPWVSRVPDQAGRTFLYEWLDRAQARGLLPAFRSVHEAQQPTPRLLQVVVYGSCARGDARPKSDLDILLRGTLSGRDANALKDLAHEVALRGGRSPDLRVVDDGAWAGSAPSFRQEVEREGKTVYSNDSNARLLESDGGGSA